MRTRGGRKQAIAGAVALTALAVLPSMLTPVPAAALDSESPGARYAIANGCFGLRSQAAGRFVAPAPGGYRATARRVTAGEQLRLKATDLGEYLLYGAGADFLAAGGRDGVARVDRARRAAEWRVRTVDGAFRLVSLSSGKELSAAPGGALRLVAPGVSGRSADFSFERAPGCIDYPEIGTGARGKPARGETPYGEVSGVFDSHLHWMAYEFQGGRFHCGRPWHRYGVEFALVDCPDHYPVRGGGAAAENLLSTPAPVGFHDPVGWPTFREWPRPESQTHEQTYYKWVERAWRAGLRLIVNDLVETGTLCEIYPLKKNSCDEMESARLQIRRLRELERYIDAQSGGPGKGWMRIVTDPFEARRVINDGKLALVIGMEVSRPFGCRIFNDRPRCDRGQIDRDLNDLHRRGLRSLFPIHKFDNALGGVRFDGGLQGGIVNAGNRYETGRFWRAEKCTGKESDNEQPIHNDVIGNALNELLPSGATPIYPDPPNCNPKGLTDLGEYAIGRLMAKRMIIEPDHMSVQSRNRTLSMLEQRGYSGVIASHSWSDERSWPRIHALGGIVTPITSGSESFVREWRDVRRVRSERRLFGFGFGADSNGLHSQPRARGTGVPNPVRYPFKSYDGRVTFERQRSGHRVYDVNRDGVPHYGLHADWIEDLKLVGGRRIVDDMFRGAEAYLQMWERTYGVPEERCRGARARFTRRGLGRQRLRAAPASLLRAGGQPRRGARAWRYCVSGEGRVSAVFTTRGRVGLVASTARRHRAFGIGRGSRSRRLRGRTRSFGRGIRFRRVGRSRIVYRVSRGRVRYVAVADRSVLASKRRLRSYLRLAGLR